MINRKQRAEIAQQTLNILKVGFYTVNGKRVDLNHELIEAKCNSKLYRPGDFDNLQFSTEFDDLQIELTRETTFGAAKRLVTEENEQKALCLNYASAKNPGGGFLGGSQAQEEALSRSSGLYTCIEQMSDYYQTHRRSKSCLYTDHMIYSPNIPVFRDDDGSRYSGMLWIKA